MNAPLPSVSPGNVVALRECLVASRDLPQDEIDLRASIEERRSEINAILRDLTFIHAAGRKPGFGTARAIEIVAQQLWQTARELRMAQPVLPSDCERGE